MGFTPFTSRNTSLEQFLDSFLVKNESTMDMSMSFGVIYGLCFSSFRH